MLSTSAMKESMYGGVAMSGSTVKSAHGDKNYRCNAKSVGMSDLGFRWKVPTGPVSSPARLQAVITNLASTVVIRTGSGVRCMAAGGLKLTTRTEDGRL